ncbi:prophage P1 protein 56 [Lactiplantibacillus plantarum]|nr:prophage P1 protein 56 [Lactiplantibacillus plantarum]
MQIKLDKTKHVVSYALLGGLEDAIDYDESQLPADFLTATDSSAYWLIDGVLAKDPNYAPSIQPVVKDQPSDEQRFQAELALQMAAMQKKQAEFNAQVLLQVADIKKAAETPVTSATPTTSEASKTPVTSEAAVMPVTSVTSEAAVMPVTSVTSETPATPATSTAAAETK